MEFVSVYGFDPSRPYISVFLSHARQLGITIAKSATSKRPYRIFVTLAIWRGGILLIRKARQRFVTYREALRSFDHAIDSIMEKAFKHGKLERQLDELRIFLRSSATVQEKQRRGEEMLSEIFLQLLGSRTANLHELKELVGEGDELVQKGVLELMEEGNFGAACCTIVGRTLPLLQGETKRILSQIPRVNRRKQALGLIWEYYLWYTGKFQKRLLALTAEGEKLSKGLVCVDDFQYLVDQCLKDVSPCPYPWRLEQAFLAVEAVKTKVAEKQFLDRKTLGLLRRALTYARQELEWLELRDKTDLPAKRQQNFTFLQGVA